MLNYIESIQLHIFALKILGWAFLSHANEFNKRLIHSRHEKCFEDVPTIYIMSIKGDFTRAIALI